MDTWQNPNGFRFLVPLKITSSILTDRSTEIFCSPKTQRMASTILLFPHPLGPTTAVTPSPKFRSVLLRKDLNPCKLSLEMYMC